MTEQVEGAAALVDQHGVPIRSMVPRARAPRMGYDAGTNRGPLADWAPSRQPVDVAMAMAADTMGGRVDDLVRNNGWASAAVTKAVDMAVGNSFRLSALPQAERLGLTPEQAADLAKQIEREWSRFAEDPGFYCDVARKTDMGGLFGLAYRHKFKDGDAIGVLRWLPRRNPRYATSVLVMHPSRLCNPHYAMNSDRLRRGVEVIPATGEAVAYHFRQTQAGEFSYQAQQWERVRRETNHGRPVVVHHYDLESAGQQRGVSRLAPIVEKLKMSSRYDETELEAAIINAMFATYITSPHPQEQVLTSVGAKVDQDMQMIKRKSYHDEYGTLGKGSRMTMLFDGESIESVSSNHPHSGFAEFQKHALRYMASAVGTSYEQLAMDWSETNYSSARAALLEVWRHMLDERHRFIKGFVQPIYSAFLEEALDSGYIDVPSGATPFWEDRAAWCRAKWIGPARGHIDPVKEALAAKMRIEMNLSTLADEAAEQGRDIYEIMQQRVRETEMMNALGITSTSLVDMMGVAGNPALQSSEQSND